MTTVTNAPYHDYGTDINIPYVDVNRIKEIPREFREKFSETNFSKVIQRNIEREVIPKGAALISVSGRSVPTKGVDNIHMRVTTQPAGGVEVEFPVDARAVNTAEITSVKDKPTVLQVLSRADISYLVTPEANILGENSSIHSEYMTDAREALASKMDNVFISKLKLAAKSTAAGAKWDADTTDPDGDINDAITRIIENTSIDPNSGEGTGTGKWTLVLPIKAYGVLKQTRVIDNHRLTYEQYLLQKHKVQILWTRDRFGGKEKSGIGSDGFLFPTMDRKVGQFYMFSGRAGVPSMYREVNPRGEKITMQYWMDFIAGPNEETGDFTYTNTNKNNRIQQITTIL